MEKRILGTPNLRWIFLLSTLLFFVPESNACSPRTPYARSTNLPQITQLKNLRLDTEIIESCTPTGVRFGAVLVVPEGRYETETEALRTAIRTHCPCAGFEDAAIPIYFDANVPPDILETRNVIAIGNMETNGFIGDLYRQWYTLLDLKYPGGDGFVVRSLHDPLGTGKNVVFLGGSGDAGVGRAAARFIEILNSVPCAADGSLSVPRLMDIALSDAYQPPEIGVDIGLDVADWDVPTWRDFYRLHELQKHFGWNPLGMSGILYYMTGDAAYLDLFKSLADPDPNAIPAPLHDNPAFYDEANPLVDNYHYFSHLVDFVYDLIEESPGFTDEERLFVTNRLLEHQDFLDPSHTALATTPDRHCSYDLLNIYTGSRYFAKYYPDIAWNDSWNDGTTIWERRMGNVRTSFRSFIGDPAWVDTLAWVPNYTEVVFDFFMLDGFEDFVRDPATGYQTAETMMRIHEILRTGKERDGYNTLDFLTVNLLNKAARMLGDERYVWLLKDLDFETESFRIGPSFWHPAENPAPPEDLTNRVVRFPLAHSLWQSSNSFLSADRRIPEEEGFQALSFRSGISKYDDFVQIDGFYGKGRNPYHLNSIYWLRMFGDPATEREGIPILWGYENDVDILHDGMSPLNPQRCAALNVWHFDEGEKMLYLETEVPNMPESRWKRHLFVIRDNAAIVVDDVTARSSGQFEIACSWSLFTSAFHLDSLPDVTTSRNLRISHGDGAAIIPGEVVNVVNGTEFRETLVQKTIADLQAGQSVAVGNAFSRTNENSFVIRRVKDHPKAYLLTKDGVRHALLALGAFSSGGFAVEADFAYLNSEVAFVVENGQAQTTSQPDPGGFSAMLNGLEIQTHPAQGEPIRIDRAADGVRNFSGEFEILENSDDGRIWGAVNRSGASTLFAIDPAESATPVEIDCDARAMSMAPAKNPAQSAAFDLLAGFEDFTLRAYRIDGTSLREIWRQTTELDEETATYSYSWFLSDWPGVHALLVDDFWNTGQRIAVGLASTMEIRGLDGQLVDRTMTRWGPNTHLGLLAGVNTHGRVLVAGKAYTGYPFFTGMVEDGAGVGIVSENLFYESGTGEAQTASGETFAYMSAWNQIGVDGLAIGDIDNDGKEEVVVTLEGNWNELRVHRGDDASVYAVYSTPEWLRYFGPSFAGDDYMKGVALFPCENGEKAIVTAARDGRVMVFSAAGAPVPPWPLHFNREISCMTVLDSDTAVPKIAVGFADGVLTVLDKTGRTVFTGQADAAPAAFARDRSRLYSGGTDGSLTTFPLHLPGMLAHWPLDEVSGSQAADVSGAGNHGSLEGTPRWQPGGGIIDGASAFDGADDAIRLDATAFFEFDTGLTLGVWIHPAGFPDPGRSVVLASKIDSSGGDTIGFELLLESDGNVRFVSNAIRDPGVLTSLEALPPNAWTHVAATVEPGACRLFVNGVPSGNVATRNDFSLSNDSALFLAGRGEGTDGFRGLLDDLRVYNIALSRSEIVAVATHSDLKGDVDGNGDVDLLDCIVSLRVLSGLEPSEVRRDYQLSGADVDGNGSVGFAEVLYILRKVSG